MRIIAGEFRGRPIKALDGRVTRPTTDRVREAMMSALFSAFGQLDASGMLALDAFAGSGALGLELLSRGGDRVIFVEEHPKAASIVKGNIAALGLDPTRATLIKTDVLTAVHRLKNTLGDQAINVIFADPPYETAPTVVFKLIEDLQAAQVLAPTCTLVYEHEKRALAGIELDPTIELIKQKTYGSTELSFCRISSAQDR